MALSVATMGGEASPYLGVPTFAISKPLSKIVDIAVNVDMLFELCQQASFPPSSLDDLTIKFTHGNLRVKKNPGQYSEKKDFNLGWHYLVPFWDGQRLKMCSQILLDVPAHISSSESATTGETRTNSHATDVSEDISSTLIHELLHQKRFNLRKLFYSRRVATTAIQRALAPAYPLVAETIYRNRPSLFHGEEAGIEAETIDLMIANEELSRLVVINPRRR